MPTHPATGHASQQGAADRAHGSAAFDGPPPVAATVPAAAPATVPAAAPTAAPTAATDPTAPISPDGSAPLVGDDPTVRHRLQHRVIAYWRWRLAMAVLPAVVLLGGLAWVLPIGVPGLAWAVVAVSVIVVVVALLVLPPIRYRVFWFAVSPSEIDIQHGIIFVKRTVVPLERVQSLRTERGPIADYYGMASLHIRTAGGSVNISGLRRSEADELCTRISRLTELADNI